MYQPKPVKKLQIEKAEAYLEICPNDLRKILSINGK
jgi:hypothetical protein